MNILNINEWMQHQDEERINEIISFGNKMYPNFGNVVIIAGGAGSGKGFALANNLAISGKVFDVDELKKLVIKSSKIAKKIKDEYNIDVSSLDLKHPSDVQKLHNIVGDELGLVQKEKSALYSSILAASPDRKPNIIFDVTLKDLAKLQAITHDVLELGYDKTKIHIVWVLNDVSVAQSQNKNRDRMIPSDILLNTHRGVSFTMHDIINMGDKLNRYMDGDIWIAFSKKDTDTFVYEAKLKKDELKNRSAKLGGKLFVFLNQLKIKEAGKPVNLKKLTTTIRNKINDYTPNAVSWE